MAIDPSTFRPVNVVDTCGVWHLLSSVLLHGTARGANCDFCITDTVYYECLVKPRTSMTAGQQALILRLQKERSQGRFQSHTVDIADLQTLSGDTLRKRLGRGEISAIAFAKKIGQAVLTDDQRARRFAVEAGCQWVQTTPHLFAWLLFTRRLGYTDLAIVIEQHEAFEGKLSKHFRDAADIALQCQLSARTIPSANGISMTVGDEP